MIDETMSRLSVVCEADSPLIGNSLDDNSEREREIVEVSAQVDLKSLKKGWHNIIITCDNMHEGNQG